MTKVLYVKAVNSLIAAIEPLCRYSQKIMYYVWTFIYLYLIKIIQVFPSKIQSSKISTFGDHCHDFVKVKEALTKIRKRNVDKSGEEIGNTRRNQQMNGEMLTGLV